MKVTRKINVTTVQYGFALEIDGKQWLLEDEQHLAEAIVFRVLMGCKKPTSKKRMRQLLSLAAYKQFFIQHRGTGTQRIKKASVSQ